MVGEGTDIFKCIVLRSLEASHGVLLNFNHTQMRRKMMDRKKHRQSCHQKQQEVPNFLFSLLRSG
jgi:hypothetical protein